MAGDYDLLISMGFEEARVKIAVKKSGGLQGALNWLEENQDKTTEELEAAAAAAPEEDEAAGGPSVAGLEGEQQAMSLVCNECGKKFRSHAQAEFHASKTEHTDFSESTEELAPLTEEEKKARLEELREKLKEKKAKQSEQDKEDAKRNEKIRMKSTKETQDLKEDLARKEQIKEAAKKRQERAADLEAKQRIRAKIEADKAERKRKAEEAKAAREGRAPAEPSSASAPAPAAAASVPKPAAAHSEARLRLQLPSGNVMKTLPADTTLFEVAQQIQAEQGVVVSKLTMTFPRKVFEQGLDFGQTLKEAGLVPSAVLIVN